MASTWLFVGTDGRNPQNGKINIYVEIAIRSLQKKDGGNGLTFLSNTESPLKLHMLPQNCKVKLFAASYL